MNRFGELPAIEWCGLIERLCLVFEQRQIVQRIVDKIGLVVAAGMGRNGLATTGDLDPLDISLGHNLLMTVARRHRVIVVAVTHQRQGSDAGGHLVTGLIGRRRQWHERRNVSPHTLGDRSAVASQDRLTPLGAGIEEAGVERVKTIGDG